MGTNVFAKLELFTIPKLVFKSAILSFNFLKKHFQSEKVCTLFLCNKKAIKR